MKKNVKEKCTQNSLKRSSSFQLGKPSYAGKLLDSALAKLSSDKLTKKTQSTLDKYGDKNKLQLTKSNSKENSNSTRSLRNECKDDVSDVYPVNRDNLIKHIKEVYDECIVNEECNESNVSALIVSSVSRFIETNKLSKMALKAIIQKHVLLELDSLSKKYKDGSDENRTIYKKELKLQVLLRFELKIVSDNCEESLDTDLVDNCSELIERLILCTPDKNEWKMFLKEKLVDKYKDKLGLTLSHVYLSIGQEPPSCLPEITSDSELSAASNFDNSFNDTNEEKKRTFQTEISPRLNGRVDLGLFANESENSLLLAACSSNTQSSGSTPMTGSSILSHNVRVLRSSTDHSNNTNPPPASRCLTALMTASSSKHSRRKPSTPTKRILTSPNSYSNSAKRRKQSSSRSKSRSEKKSKTTSKRRLIRETPRRESKPRWERATLAAAKKIGDKKIVVSESPAKLKNPLGRSQSLSLLTSYAKYSNNQTRLQDLNNQNSANLSRTNSFVAGGVVGAQSSVMERAAAWRLKQAEQEISLSQFFIGEATDEDYYSAQSIHTDSVSKKNSMPSSVVPNIGLRRRNSNLFANFSPGDGSDVENVAPSPIKSPAHFTSPRKQDPVGNLLFTPTKSILKSTPIAETNFSSPSQSCGAGRSVLLSPKVRRRTFCDTKPPQVFYEDTMFMDEKEFFTHSGSKKSPRTRRTSNSKSGLTPTYNRVSISNESPSRPRPSTRKAMSNAPSLPPWLKKKGSDVHFNDSSESSASGHMLRRRLFGDQPNIKESVPFSSLSVDNAAESSSCDARFARSESERSLGFQVSNIDLNRAMH